MRGSDQGPVGSPSRARSNTISLRLPPRFDLARAVCSYGYFLLAPNHWDKGALALHRPLRGERDRIVQTVITQRRGSDRLAIRCTPAAGRTEREPLLRQVARMLRLDEPPELFAQWHRVNPAARRAGFGRLFRSPTLFEDLVKTMTTCNVTWPNTMRMNQNLCAEVGGGAFPTPGELAAVRADTLQRRCRVGYRAARIVGLARDVERGRLDLSPLEDRSRSTEEVFEALLGIHGIGPYGAGNLCQLLGRYDRLAIDTETYRHFRQEHGINTPASGNRAHLHPTIEAYYAKFAPFQFLAYWFELWGAYERRVGDAREWDRERDGGRFTADKLK